MQVFCFFFLFFLNRVSLCSPGGSGTYSIDQAGFDLGDPPASASVVLGLKVCATNAQHKVGLIFLPQVTHG